MNIEDKIFTKYTPDFNKLKEYGFKKYGNEFKTEVTFKNGLFKAVITINSKGKISAIVYDLENNDEYLPLRVKSNQGAFVGEVKTSYEELLINIRNNCFTSKYYIFPQSNRISDLIIKKYGDKPEFLWKKFSGTGVFRNSKTNKWYLVILDVDKSKIQQGAKGEVEVADVKLPPEKIEKLLKREHFYPAYHMNKKHWITIILDDSVSDEKIMELVEESYGFTV